MAKKKYRMASNSRKSSAFRPIAPVIDLKIENNRLLNDLKNAKKRIQLLESYRYWLMSFYNKCKCDENINNKNIINLLENDYKSLQTIGDNVESDRNLVKYDLYNRKCSENRDKSQSFASHLCQNLKINKAFELITHQNIESVVGNNGSQTHSIHEDFGSDDCLKDTQSCAEIVVNNNNIYNEIIIDNKRIRKKKFNKNNVINNNEEKSSELNQNKYKKSLENIIINNKVNNVLSELFDKIHNKSIENENIEKSLNEHNYGFNFDKYIAFREEVISYLNTNNYKTEIDPKNEFILVFNDEKELISDNNKVIFLCLWPECQQMSYERDFIDYHISESHSYINIFKPKTTEAANNQTSKLIPVLNPSLSSENKYILLLPVNTVQNPIVLNHDMNSDSQEVEDIKRKYKELTEIEIKKTKAKIKSNNKVIVDQMVLKRDLLFKELKRYFKNKDTNNEIFRNNTNEHIDEKYDNLLIVKGINLHMNGSKDKIIGYKCGFPNCGFSHLDRTSLIEHLEAKHSDNQYFCDKCNAKFKLKSILKTHKVRTHSTDRHECDYNGCQFITNNIFTFRRHKILHSGEHNKKFICDWPECEAKYFEKRSLIIHINRVHKNVRPYVCQWPGCESAFYTKSFLRNHERIHTNERPFVCDWPECDRKFTAMGPLLVHKSIHKGLKPHSCQWSECQMKFLRTGDLKRHLECHRSGRRMKCKCCANRTEDNNTIIEKYRSIRLKYK